MGDFFKDYGFFILIIAVLLFMISWIIWKLYYWRGKTRKITDEIKKPLLKTEGFIKKFCTSGRKEAEPKNIDESNN